MKPIDNKIMSRFFDLAALKIKGEWVLIGGALLPSLQRGNRVTVDIDFARKNKSSETFQVEFMEVAEQLGLPVEAINLAGEYFLHKIQNFNKDLVKFYEHKKFIVYRPNVNLFIKLKVPRLSESDLSDCKEFIQYAKEIEEPLDVRALQTLVEIEMEKCDHRLNRLETLKAFFAD